MKHESEPYLVCGSVHGESSALQPVGNWPGLAWPDVLAVRGRRAGQPGSSSSQLIIQASPSHTWQ